MTPAHFSKLAEQIAGPYWRSKLGPMIGKGRTQVWCYANDVWPVPETVARLMTLLAAHNNSNRKESA